jgi:hypothetical protein
MKFQEFLKFCVIYQIHETYKNVENSKQNFCGLKIHITKMIKLLELQNF